MKLSQRGGTANQQFSKAFLNFGTFIRATP